MYDWEDDDDDGDANHEEEDEEEDEEGAIKSVINGGDLGGFAGARPPLPNGFITA